LFPTVCCAPGHSSRGQCQHSAVRSLPSSNHQAPTFQSTAAELSKRLRPPLEKFHRPTRSPLFTTCLCQTANVHLGSCEILAFFVDVVLFVVMDPSSAARRTRLYTLVITAVSSCTGYSCTSRGTVDQPMGHVACAPWAWNKTSHVPRFKDHLGVDMGLGPVN
jgi:hypothetical protein